jgi:predicted TIM-barrel fold metal-dependent hydrolase
MLTPSATTLRHCNAAIKSWEGEHLLYGTNHPFGRPDLAAELVERLNCSASDRELIYHGNADRLLNLKHLAVAA